MARAILNHPLILKPLLAACNLAGRALKRDLKIDNIDTYEPTLTCAQANAVAGCLLSFLPQYIELPALSRIDRVSFIDKEIRKQSQSDHLAQDFKRRVRGEQNQQIPRPTL